MRDLTKKIHGHAGHEFNIDSTRQLANVLFDDRGAIVAKGDTPTKLSHPGRRASPSTGRPAGLGRSSTITRLLHTTGFDRIVPVVDDPDEATDFPREVCATYERRCEALIDGLGRIGWEVAKPGGTMFVWAPIPEPYRELGSLEFTKKLLQDAKVAVSPGIGFGQYGDDFVRFGLIENEHRTRQAIRSIKRMIKQDGFD